MIEEAQGVNWRLLQLGFKGYPATAIRGIPVAATVLPVYTAHVPLLLCSTVSFRFCSYDWMRSVLGNVLL